MNEYPLVDNGLQIRQFSLIYRYFAYVDTPDYLADNLFVKYGVKVGFLKEYYRPHNRYRLILCRCRKKHTAAFVKALAELPDKMLICGHEDYQDACRDLINTVTKHQRPDSGETTEA